MQQRILTLSTAAAVAFSCLLGLPGNGVADIYQRVDENGTVHYTNVQPKGRGWKRVVRSKAPHAKRPGRSKRAPKRSSGDPLERLRRFEAYVAEAARLYQLPAAFIRAVMRVESNFSPEVVSNKGAMGLMQLMPHTAASMGVHDPFDPRQNILGGARYLRVLANQFQGDIVLTLAAYNAGHGAVLRYQGVPPYEETRRYVKRVLTHYHAFRGGRQEGLRTALGEATALRAP